MKIARYISLMALLFSFQFIVSQTSPLILIEESDMNDPYQLQDWIMNTLHGGGGEFDTASIKFTGNPKQLGKFTRGITSIEMDSGLVISTGEATSLSAHNMRHNDSFNFYGQPDPDLDKMYEDFLGVPLFPPPPGGLKYTGDAAYIEFDYIPYGDEIQLRYVFGSEEYKYWMFPNSPPDDINLTAGPYDLTRMFDIFGIHIDRPGRPFENLATLPDLAGGGDVNVSTVSDLSNDLFYIGNPVGGGAYGVEWDGFTKNMDALLIRKEVIPCIKYHVKVSIQDFLVQNDVSPDLNGYLYNSGVHLGGGSLIGGEDAPPWTVNYDWTHTNVNFEGQLIEGGCNELLVTFKLAYATASTVPYYIPFKIESAIYRDNILFTYDDTGEILPVDSVMFSYGETEKTIRLSAINLTDDFDNIKFTYPQNPCERPHPPIGGGSFTGIIPFELVNNEPFSFNANPKVYSAYCKETIELTVTDITNGGVDPVIYVWPTNPTPPVDTYNYTVNASPDFVTVGVKDLCDNDTTMQIRIDNLPIHLVDIPTISFCKPGMSQLVEVKADQNYHNFPGYGFSNVDWFSLAYTPPQNLGSGNPKLITYDDNFVEMLYQIKYNVTDVCGANTTDTLTVDQTGKLDVGDDKYRCKGESVTLINYTPVWQDDPNNYEWYRKVNNGSMEFLGYTNTVTDIPPDTTMYYLKIFDKCEETQWDSLKVFVDHFLPTIAITPSSAEVCPGESVTLTGNQANTYLWTPGGATTQSITLIETTPAVYNYTLTASSDYCIDKEVSASFEVFPQPSAVFSFDPAEEACTGEDIQFTYDDDPADKDLYWDFDDGATSTIPNPIHAYVNPGTYNVYLHVQQYICEDEITIPVIVNPLPSPDFTVDVNEGCIPVDVQFTDLSEDLYPGAQYVWTFGDGNTSGVPNPTHQYNQAGWYSVGLTIHNTERCFASISKPNLIQVNPNPFADFEADPWITTMDDPEISFFNLSDSDSVLIIFDWDFGDGNTSGDENPVNIYQQPGDYDILMRIETVNGCWDTIIGKVAVTEFVKLYIPNAFTPNGDGLNDVFEIKGTPVTDFNLYIYDRWGGLVWSTHNYETRWEGKDYSGNPVPPGSYVYQITGTDYRMEGVSFKGMVTVVK